MQENEILSAVASRFVDELKYEFTVPITSPIIKKRSLIDRILRRPIPEVETERSFTIYSCKVGNMFRVAGRALMLPDEFVSGCLVESVLPVLLKHKDDMVYIIASAIQNNHLEPSKDLIEFIDRNFDNRQIFEVLNYAIDALELQSFLNSIVLAKGTIRILKPNTSPKDGSELIASHMQS